MATQYTNSRIWFLFTNLCLKILQGVTLIAVAMNVSPTEYGEFSNYMSISGFVLTVLLYGLVEYYLVSHCDEDFTLDLLKWSVILSSVAFLIVVLLPVKSIFVLIFLWFFSSKALPHLISAVFQMKKKFWLVSLVNIFVACVLIANLIYFFISEISLELFLYYSIVSLILVQLVWFQDFRLMSNFGKLLKYPSLSFINDSRPFIYTSIFVYIYMSSDVVMLFYLDSAEVSGLYAAAAAILFAAYLVMDVLYKYMLPFLSEDFSHKNEATNFNEYMSIVAIFAILVVIYLCTQAANIVSIFYSNEYTDSSSIIITLSFVLLIHSFCYPLGAMISGSGRQVLKNKVQIIAALLNISLNLVLIPNYSWTGAVIATIGSELVLFLGYFYIVKKAGIKIKINVRKVILSMVAGLIVVVISDVLMSNKGVIGFDYLNQFITIILFGIAFVLLSYKSFRVILK
jgi:O-antigen/teichoic acid export membrane protein